MHYKIHISLYHHIYILYYIIEHWISRQTTRVWGPAPLNSSLSFSGVIRFQWYPIDPFWIELSWDPLTTPPRSLLPSDLKASQAQPCRISMDQWIRVQIRIVCQFFQLECVPIPWESKHKGYMNPLPSKNWAIYLRPWHIQKNHSVAFYSISHIIPLYPNNIPWYPTSRSHSLVA